MKAVIVVLVINFYVSGMIVAAILNKMRIYKQHKQKYKASPSLWYSADDCFINWTLCIFFWPIMLIVSIVEIASDKLIDR